MASLQALAQLLGYLVMIAIAAGVVAGLVNVASRVWNQQRQRRLTRGLPARKREILGHWELGGAKRKVWVLEVWLPGQERPIRGPVQRILETESVYLMRIQGQELRVATNIMGGLDGRKALTLPGERWARDYTTDVDRVRIYQVLNVH